MSTELIIIEEYCRINLVEPQFIKLLQVEGLIEVFEQNGSEYITSSQLSVLERYSRWYYDLSINVEGIEVIQNLLDRIQEMQSEIKTLKQKIHLLDDYFEEDI